MDSLFAEFGDAIRQRNGYKLANTLLPESPPTEPNKLVFIWGSTNHHGVKSDVKHFISDNTYRSDLTSKEVEGWVEVYTAYWRALAEILAMESEHNGSGKPTSSWTKVYDTWKEMTSALIRGYSNYNFEAWTIPCLYVAGKHLRLFAIRSDEERNRLGGENNGVEFGIDFDPETEKHQQLRDCEQQLKRIFTLCLSDRYIFSPYQEDRIFAASGLHS
jgi:COP9 signalosome complex subunit 12